jgi:hypothetical protein
VSNQENGRKILNMKERIIGFLGLFSSTTTLLCCALPALVAAVAGGAAVATLVSSVPWLIKVSEHKGVIFLISTVLIALNAFITLWPKGKVACTITGGQGCRTAGMFQRTMLWVSVFMYLTGAFVAYGLVPILRFVETL